MRRWRPLPVPVNAIYPSNRYLSPKVRAFIDLAVTRFPEENEKARRMTSMSGAGVASGRRGRLAGHPKA
jgi:hypothetical protein